MNEKLYNIWNRQVYQIKQLTFSSVVFIVEMHNSETKIIASTDNYGYDYDVNRSVDINEFGLDKLSKGIKVINSNDILKYDFRSLMSIPINYTNNIVWGAIVLLSDKENAYCYETEQEVKVFSQSITNQIKLYSLENATIKNSEIQEDSALNFFLKSINGVPWRLDFTTKEFTYLGEQANNILGYSLEEWPTMEAWGQSIFHEDRDKVINFCYNKSLHGDDHALEYRIVKKNGEIAWIKDIVKVIQDKKGNTKELFGVMINITHSKKNEHNLSALNSQLKYILNATNTVLSIVDNNCNIIFHSHHDITSLKKKCYEYFANRKSECDNCPRLRKEKTKRTYIDKIEDKTFQVTAFPFQADMHNWHVAEIRIDISDRVSQENEILALKEMLEFSMDAANIGFFEYTIAQQKFKTNKVFKNITGYHLDDNHIDLDWVISRFHPDDIIMVREAFAKGPTHKIDFECRLLNANNEYIWINYAGQIADFDSNNKPVKISGVIKDVTATKDLLYDLMLERNRSLRASAAKSTFLANMSHEIRTPMNAIIGFTELLSKHVIEPPFDGYLKSIKSSGKVLLDLINDLLDFEKIEAGKMIINKESTDFRLLVNEIKQTFYLLAREKKVDIEIKASDYFPKSIVVDALKLRQILLNLVNNALKFTDKGCVTIEYNFSIHETSGDGILSFSVSDTGIGVPNDKKKKIFEPFVQEKNANEKRYHGTGLGLSIVQNLVHMMGGSISLASELGKGSSFSISIPNVKSSVIIGSEEDTDLIENKNFLFNNEQILIADSIKSNREVLLEIFKSLGFSCHVASTGDEVAEYINEELEMVVMNLDIEENYSFETIKNIRKIKPLSSLPVIAVSGKSKDKFMSEALMQGFSGYISTPIIEKDLVLELSKYFTPMSVNQDNYEDFIDNLSFTDEELIHIKNIFQSKIIPIWNDLMEILSMEKLNFFTNEIENVLEYSEWKDLREFNAKLKTAIKSFDFEIIQKLISNFKVYIQNLEL